MKSNVGIWIWCFPQMLAGWLVKLFTRARRVGDHYEYRVKHGSVTFGEYIFLSPDHWDDKEVLRHERGHVKQSRMLGWLYLFVIGIPSIVWAGCFANYRRKNNIDYYEFYTEQWANKLMEKKGEE